MAQTSGPTGASSTEALSYGSARGRWVLAATVLGTAVVFIDATAVNVALPQMGRDLHADISGLQWTVNAYTLALASLILLGGSLGDRFGRRKVFLIGVVWFAAASLLCGVSPNVETLIFARALQGVGGALLTPGSLAILQASFRREDRARAIGAWSGLASVAGAIGPFLGGWLVQAASWRVVFLINLPVVVAVVIITAKFVPESRDPSSARSFDVLGAALGAVGLGAVTYGLISWQGRGLGSADVLVPLVGGVLALVGFVLRERYAAEPMLPLGIFSSRQFSAANAVTVGVYAALSGQMFFLILELQVVLDYSPLQSGAALVPVTVIMLLLSARMGALAQRIGPRLPMTVGPILAGVGVAWLALIRPGSSYLTEVLPGLLLFGLGLTVTVAPLTATVLAAAPEEHAGLASGVNNAVARVAGLLAIAVLPLVAGLTGEAYTNPDLLQPAFETAMWVCSGLLLAAGVVALVTIQNPARADGLVPLEETRRSCPVDAPPLQSCPRPGPLVPTASAEKT